MDRKENVKLYRGFIIRWYDFEDKRLYNPNGTYAGMHYNPENTVDRMYSGDYGDEIRTMVKECEARNVGSLDTLCGALGWKGGTVFQAIDEANKRLKG